MACTRSSSKRSVRNAISNGLAVRKPPFMSRSNITRELRIMPTANTPTAIESTTRTVRVLLLNRSRSTLRQRGLSMAAVYLDRLVGKSPGFGLYAWAIDNLVHNLAICDDHG